MSTPLDPGPPMLIQPEYCATDAPTRSEYVRASATAAAAVVVGAVGWLGTALITQRIWGVVIVALGIMIGFAVHWAAGRHRSLYMGLMAAGATLLGPVIGYALLWLPFISPRLDRSVRWSHFVMLAVGSLIAYLLAGKRSGPWS